MVNIIEGQIISLILSFLIAGIITYTLSKWGKPQTLELKLESILTISPDIREFSLPITISPSYFSSVGKVYVTLSSPYREFLKEFKIEMSVDNYSWLEIPPYTTLPDRTELKKFVELGYVNLNQVRMMIYGKSFIPPQKIKLPSSVSKEDFLKSFEGNIVINPIKTRKDITLLVLVFVSILGTTYGILNSIMSKFILKQTEESF